MTTVRQWFKAQGWTPQTFQKDCWKAYGEGKNGMLHAPTGSGKTFALWGGILQEALKTKNILWGFKLFGFRLYALWRWRFNKRPSV